MENKYCFKFDNQPVAKRNMYAIWRLSYKNRMDIRSKGYILFRRYAEVDKFVMIRKIKEIKTRPSWMLAILDSQR